MTGMCDGTSGELDDCFDDGLNAWLLVCGAVYGWVAVVVIDVF